jgi:hypothetical protein
MRKRRPNHRIVKVHRSYTVEEVARLLGTHKNTVRAWLKAGLPTCDSKRPTLVLGRHLAEFLQLRARKNKRPCQSDEMYCLRCRTPKRPAGSIADYHPITVSLGNLSGICPDCEGMIYRRTSTEKLAAIRERLQVHFVEVAPQVNERNEPILNSNFRQVGEQ